jgi:hypothetical protein
MTRVNSAALAFILAAGLCVPALAQSEKTTDKKPAPPAPTAAQPGKPADMKMPSPEEMKKMQDAWEKASMAGPEHEFLKKAVGTWTGKVKSYEDPTKPPAESTCNETISSILGGKFTKCEVSGTMVMGGKPLPFEGLGVYGYDNAKQKYTMSWADNMGTCIMDGTGELSADKKTMTWTMNYIDPNTHKPGTMKEVDKFISDNETHMEMWGDMGMGTQVKFMEMDLTRSGDAKPAATDMKAKPAAAPAPTKK